MPRVCSSAVFGGWDSLEKRRHAQLDILHNSTNKPHVRLRFGAACVGRGPPSCLAKHLHYHSASQRGLRGAGGERVTLGVNAARAGGTGAALSAHVVVDTAGFVCGTRDGSHVDTVELTLGKWEL